MRHKESKPLDAAHPQGEKRVVTLRLNGKTRYGECEPRRLLSDFIRHDLGATGTHVGCEHGVCGACTVHIDGVAGRSCLMLAVQADGRNIDTVEGLSDGEALGDLQLAFRRNHALQCGFCTAGMLMTGHALLTEEPDADATRIREVLSGNICRCTGYIGIVDAVMEARPSYRNKSEGY